MDGEPWELPCKHWELPDLPGPHTTTPVNHARRPSKSSFVFVELFSGLGAFTMMLLALGGMLLGYCEKNPASWTTFHHKFPEAYHVEDYMDLEAYSPFVSWCTKEGKEVDIVAGGPSCKSFSVAGKQDWDNPRALCAPNTASSSSFSTSALHSGRVLRRQWPPPSPRRLVLSRPHYARPRSR